ncbi:MAG: barstar family protein [Weeksellaceae bacterium]
MGREINIDFREISDLNQFYARLNESLLLPEFFGNNLDALFDVFTGYLEMPLHLTLFNMRLDQLETFENLINTLSDIENEDIGFSFSYFMEQYDED